MLWLHVLLINYELSSSCRRCRATIESRQRIARAEHDPAAKHGSCGEVRPPQRGTTLAAKYNPRRSTTNRVDGYKYNCWRSYIGGHTQENPLAERPRRIDELDDPAITPFGSPNPCSHEVAVSVAESHLLGASGIYGNTWRDWFFGGGEHAFACYFLTVSWPLRITVTVLSISGFGDNTTKASLTQSAFPSFLLSSRHSSTQVR